LSFLLVSSYLEKNYAELKTINPQTQFLIREAKTTRPRLFANYDMGEEREVDITGMTEAEIERRIALLVDVGRTLPRNLIDPLNPTQHDEVVDFRVSPYAKAAYYTTQ
jgi:hypothetical protein